MEPLGDQRPFPLKLHDVHHLTKLAIINLLVTVLDALSSPPSSWQRRTAICLGREVLEIFTIFGIEPMMLCHCTDCRRLREQSRLRYFVVFVAELEVVAQKMQTQWMESREEIANLISEAEMVSTAWQKRRFNLFGTAGREQGNMSLDVDER